MRFRLVLPIIALAAVLFAALATPISASNGTQVFLYNGGGQTGVGLTYGETPTCLGFQPSDLLGVTRLVHTLGAQLTLSPGGNVNLGFHADTDFAYFVNPGPNGPSPHESDFAWSGNAVVDYKTAVTTLAPDQYGIQIVPLRLPFTMTSADGSSGHFMYVDYYVVIFFSGDQPSFIETSISDPACP
jgi:hypothetical protein